MTPRDVRLYVYDIVRACELVQQFTAREMLGERAVTTQVQRLGPPQGNHRRGVTQTHEDLSRRRCRDGARSRVG